MWTDYFSYGDRGIAKRMLYNNPEAEKLAKIVGTEQDLGVTKAKAEAILREAGIGLSAARLVAPTLEDVFVSVLAQKEGDTRHE